MLGLDFIGGERQEERVNIEKIDRVDSEAYNLKQHGIQIYLFPALKTTSNDKISYSLLEPEIGSYVLTQF